MTTTDRFDVRATRERAGAAALPRLERHARRAWRPWPRAEAAPALTRSDQVERAARDPWLQRAAWGAGAAVFYLLVAWLCFWPASPLTGNRLVTTSRADLAQGVWFVEWFAYAVTHGLNPFYTHYLLAPRGANLALDNTSPLLGLLALPVTLTAGPVAAYNLLFRLAVGLTGLGMYCMLRRYTTWRPAALLGGLVFELCPFVIGHAHKHVFLVFLVFVPFLVLVVDDWLVRQSRGPIASGLLLGLLAGLEFLVSVEVFVEFVIFALVGLAFLALAHRREVREGWGQLWRRLWLGTLIAIPVFGVLAGYPFAMMIFGPLRPAHGLHNPVDLARYHGDLLAPLFPTRYIWLHFSNLAQSFVGGNAAENSFYLGLPLVLVLAYLVWRFRHEAVIAAAAVVAGVAFVLALGPRLYVDQHVVFSPMPFALFTHLPLLRNLEDARLTLFMWFGAATILAVGVDRLRASGWRWLRPSDSRGPRDRRAGKARAAFAGLVVLVALAPMAPHLPLVSKHFAVPSFFTTKSELDLIPKGDLVLTFPYNRAPYDDPMLWQTVSHMRFRIFGGEATVPGPHGVPLGHAPPDAPSPLATLLLSGWPLDHGRYDLHPPDGPELVPMLQTYLRQNGVNDVLVKVSAVNARLVVKLVEEALGAQPRQLGGVDLWLDVPARLHDVHGSGSAGAG